GHSLRQRRRRPPGSTTGGSFVVPGCILGSRCSLGAPVGALPVPLAVPTGVHLALPDGVLPGWSAIRRGTGAAPGRSLADVPGSRHATSTSPCSSVTAASAHLHDPYAELAESGACVGRLGTGSP